jgi:hypothetical protein
MANPFDTINPPAQPTAPEPKVNIFDAINPPKAAQPDLDPNTDFMAAQGSYGPEERKTLLNALPIGGGIYGGPLGAAAGSFAKQALSPDTPDVGEAVKDTFLNGIIPKGIEEGMQMGQVGFRGALAKILSKFPNLASKLPGVQKADIINQMTSKMVPEADNVAVAAENARANTPFPSQAQKEATHGLFDVPFEQTEINTTKIRPLVKNLFNDVTDVRNAKLSGVSQQRLSSLAASDLVTRNYSAAQQSFNAPKILDELTGPKADIYKEAMGDGYKTFKELAELGTQKGVGVKAMSPVQTMFYEGKRIFFGSLAGGVLGLPAHVSAGLVLGSDAIAHIAADPKLGQLVIQAMKTPGTAPESTLLTKAVLAGLRGTTVYLQNSDGQKDAATIQTDPQTGETRLQYSRNPK